MTGSNDGGATLHPDAAARAALTNRPVVVLEPTLLAWADPQTAQDTSPRIIDVGCIWGTPQ
jgi:hypothetical protein